MSGPSKIPVLMIVIANVPIKVGVVLHFIIRITILILKKYHLLKKKTAWQFTWSQTVDFRYPQPIKIHVTVAGFQLHT